MFGSQQQQQQVKQEFPDQETKALFGKLMYHTSETYSRTFIPLTLVNRKAVVGHLQESKKIIDQLLRVV